VVFSSYGPLVNETFDDTSTVTVTLAGDYQIDYSVSITAGVGSAIAITVNGTVPDPSSTNIAALVTTGQVTGQAILTLAAGDVITLHNNSTTSFTLTTTPNIGAQLTIDKLD
jgi:hypothetical protein